jgi:phage tail sheath protein FI
MPERLHPGVYVEERSGGVRPIEGVSTSTAAFIGEAQRGIPALAQFLTSYTEYERAFGSHQPGEAGLLAAAVDGFFASGGRRAYVVRVLPADAVKAQSAAVPTRIAADPPGALQFVARGAGRWADAIRITVADSTAFREDAFRIDVSWTEGGGAPRRLETFDDVRMDPSHEDYVGERLKTSRYVDVVDLYAAALDADPTATLIAAQAPRAIARPPGASGTYLMYEGKVFTVTSWDVATPDATPTRQSVTFDQATLAGSLQVPVVSIAPATGATWNLTGEEIVITVNGGAAVDVAVAAATPAQTTAAEIAAAINASTAGVTAVVAGTPAAPTVRVTGRNNAAGAPTLTVASSPTPARIVTAALPPSAPTFSNGSVQLTPAQFATVLSAALTSFDAPPDADPPSIGVRVGRAPVVVIAPANGTTWNLNNEQLAITMNGAAAVTFPVAAANPAQTTAAEIAAAISASAAGLTAAVTGTPAAPTVTVTGRTSETATPTLTIAATPTAGRIATTSPVTGVQGLGPERWGGLRMTVAENITATAPGVLRSIGFAPSSRGYAANSAANPLIRPATTTAPVRLIGGSDGTSALVPADFEGDARERTGLHALDNVDVNIVAIPGRTDPAFLAIGVAYCDNRGDCFYLFDGPGSVDRQMQVKPDEAKQFVESLPIRSKNSAIYFPWIRVPDPTGVGRNPTRFVPPSGHVAGIFARTDVTRGVWKAPAGVEAAVPEAIGLQYQVIDAEQDLLNPASLNCLRSFPGIGIVSWGTRTLSSDPEWRYVPVRRMGLFLKESLRRGLQWAVFEPNDEELWGRIKINIQAFMMTLFRQGAFQGSTPDEAFLVACDRSTNPQENVDAGIVTAQVAFAPLKPAEFVVIEISQKSLLVA